MTGHEIGAEELGTVAFSYWLEGDRLYFELKAKADDKVVYTQSCQLKRKGLVATTTP